MGKLRELARVDGFCALLVGQTLLWLGSTTATIALVFAVLQSEHGMLGAGSMLAARSVPTVLFGLFGGVAADRLRKRTIVVAASWSSAAVQACIAVLVVGGIPGIWVLVGAVALLGTVTALASSSFYSLPAEILDAASLQPAQAVLRLSRNGTAILGPAVGGWLTVAVGPAWLIAGDAALAILAGLVLRRLRVSARGEQRPGTLADLRAGWSEFASRRWLVVAVPAFSVALLAWGGGFSVLGPAYALRFEEPARLWGLIAGVLAAGYVLGAVLAVRWQPRRPVVHSLLAQSVTCVLLIALWLDAPVPVLLGAAFVAGCALEQAGVVWAAAMQRHIPVEVLGRVSSYDYIGTFGLVPIGYALAGPLAAGVGTSTALLIASVVVAVPPLVAARTSAVRRVVEQPPPTEPGQPGRAAATAESVT